MRKPRPGVRPATAATDNGSELDGLRNIGPTIAQRLREVGIRTRTDLERVGAAEAFRLVTQRYPNRTISVCYYLYSLQGALMDVHWDDLPAALKDDLRREAGV